MIPVPVARLSRAAKGRQTLGLLADTLTAVLSAVGMKAEG